MTKREEDRVMKDLRRAIMSDDRAFKRRVNWSLTMLVVAIVTAVIVHFAL